MGGRAGMGVRPQRGPGWQRALPARYRQRCDLQEWLVGLPGLEPGTSSLSGFCTRACYRRIAPVTWANDIPLETVANRSIPMACGPPLSCRTDPAKRIRPAPQRVPRSADHGMVACTW
jgi:hypothetical protein